MIVPLLRELELADAGGAGAGEGAALVAEQLALEQVGRQRRAVDLDERLGPPRRAAVQLAGDHFLADAALAAQQHADVAVGDALDHRHHRLHRRAGAPATAARPAGSSASLGAEARDLGAQRLALEGVADRRFERGLADAVRVARLEHVVGGAEPHRLDDRRRRLAARQHDHLRRGPRLADRPQRLDAVQVRHQHVQQDDVGRRAAAQAFEQRGAAVEHLDRRSPGAASSVCR